uniref:Uncharacterized protein n=1 Tax=Kalanchoe fedtschenkoi TaxID=63787 RepID=A0A7N0REM9_KALFE
MLPECQSLIEELAASHSTDLQQRAYELQALIGLDAHAVERIMPADASCEDIEIDKSISFLNNYVQQAVEKGAQPYLPESERNGLSSRNTFRNQHEHESSQHTLKFEAYELPKPSVPFKAVPPSQANDFALVPDTSYPKETPQSAPFVSVSDRGPAELRLRLDGVQKKWGQPSYSSSTAPTSSSTPSKSANGVAQLGGGEASNIKRDVPFDSKRTQVEISPEKQKLAASLFGGSSKPDKKTASSSHKSARTHNHSVEKLQGTKAPSTTSEPVELETPVRPPPDLLDLGEPTPASNPSSVDPFKQLEGLLEPGQGSSAGNHNSSSCSRAKPLGLVPHSCRLSEP